MSSQSHRYPGHLQSSGPNFLPTGRYVLYKLPSITAAHNKVQIEKLRGSKISKYIWKKIQMYNRDGK